MSIFGNREEEGGTKRMVASTGAPADINTIGAGTTIEGTVRTKNDVRISGKLVGELHAEGRAIVSPEGHVEGNIVAASAELAGKVTGDLHIRERLVLKESAIFSGNIKTQKLVIEDGAKFSGRCDMGSGAAQQPAPTAPANVSSPNKTPHPQKV